MPKDHPREHKSGRLALSVAVIVLSLLISLITGGDPGAIHFVVILGYLALMGIVGRDPKGPKAPRVLTLTALATVLAAIFTMMALPRTILAARGESVSGTFVQLATTSRGGGRAQPYLFVDDRGKPIKETFHKGFRVSEWSPEIGEKIDLVVDPKGMAGMWPRSDVDNWWWMSLLAIAGMAGVVVVNSRRFNRLA